MYLGWMVKVHVQGIAQDASLMHVADAPID